MRRTVSVWRPVLSTFENAAVRGSCCLFFAFVVKGAKPDDLEGGRCDGNDGSFPRDGRADGWEAPSLRLDFVRVRFGLDFTFTFI